MLVPPLMMLSLCPIAAPDWSELFDGRSLNGWTAAEHPESWTVQDGCLVAHGERSHLFYTGDIADHDFRNFELTVEAMTEPGANSGVYFHTQHQDTGWPSQGYEVQINNSYFGWGQYKELKCTGGLYAVRDIAKRFVKDNEWFTMTIRVAGNRVRVLVNGHLTVDYLQPENPPRKPDLAGRILSHGTFALQGHDPKSICRFRRVAVRVLPDGADQSEPPRASDEGYGVTPGLMDRVCGSDRPFLDFHVHLRGGMTGEKAVLRQAVTGINLGVLENLGAGWPLHDDATLREFLDGLAGLPLYVGVQVNDRDWYTKHDPALLARLDYVLADTMIMPMPTDADPPVKLWLADGYSIDDPEAWMERYLQHNLRVLAEPVSILANPTWLPPVVKELYDQLWTDERMKTIIQAANDNHVALEINALSGYPQDRFIRLAKQMGAKFSFGTNNFDDQPMDLTRCFQALDLYGLKMRELFVPELK